MEAFVSKLVALIANIVRTAAVTFSVHAREECDEAAEAITLDRMDVVIRKSLSIGLHLIR